MTVTPRHVVLARRGFVYSTAIGGSGTFQDDDIQRAEDFFDGAAEDGYWTEEFYLTYAAMGESGTL